MAPHTEVGAPDPSLRTPSICRSLHAVPCSRPYMCMYFIFALPKYMCFYPAPARVLYVLLIPTYTHI